MKRCIGGIALVATSFAVLLMMSTAAMAGYSAPTETSWASSSAALRSRDFPYSSHLAAPSGTGVIRGTVLNYAGLPVPGAYLGWQWPNGGIRTDATGSYEMTGVAPLAGTGQLWMLPGGVHGPLYFCRGLTFFDPGPTTFDFWPGRLPLSIQRGGPWAAGSSVSVSLFGSSTTSPDLEADQPLRVGSADPFNGYVYALPGDYTSAVVTFHGGGSPLRRSEALEIEMPPGAPAVVQSGQTGGVSLAADERDAARAEVSRWASGSRGSMVTLRLSNLRSGDVYKITGQSMNGGEPAKSFATVTVPSPAPSVVSLRVRVPLGIPTGDKYNFFATRIGGHLDLVASYQVCAFSASRHSIARGESVKLRGRVPIIPSDRGPFNTMTLTLFKHAGVAGQPWTWQAKGWTKVTALRTGFMTGGRFSTPYLHPWRTMSYVIRFPRSFDPSWRGFTSVETVHVN